MITPIDVKTSNDTFDAHCAIELGAADLAVGRLMRRLIDIFAYDPQKFPTDQLAELRTATYS